MTATTPGPAPAYTASLWRQRCAEVVLVREAVQAWAANEPDVVAVGLAGSWARGTARLDSDVDLVVLTEEPARFVGQDDWVERAVGRAATVVRTRTWGPLTERRLRLAGGLEVELGFVLPGWAAEPVDEGTARVVREGFRVLHDPRGILRRLVGAVAAAESGGS